MKDKIRLRRGEYQSNTKKSSIPENRKKGPPPPPLAPKKLPSNSTKK